MEAKRALSKLSDRFPVSFNKIQQALKVFILKALTSVLKNPTAREQLSAVPLTDSSSGGSPAAPRRATGMIRSRKISLRELK